MIVDTSAIVAIVLNEPEKPIFVKALIHADQASMSAGSWLELEAVVVRRGNPALAAAAERMLADMDVEIVGVSIEQARTGRAAYRKFGRGTGHPAGLNFGDCFSYALAQSTGRPLLFKGEDFANTDIEAAV